MLSAADLKFLRLSSRDPTTVQMTIPLATLPLLHIVQYRLLFGHVSSHLDLRIGPVTGYHSVPKIKLCWPAGSLLFCWNICGGSGIKLCNVKDIAFFQIIWCGCNALEHISQHKFGWSRRQYLSFSSMYVSTVWFVELDNSKKICYELHGMRRIPGILQCLRCCWSVPTQQRLFALWTFKPTVRRCFVKKSIS